MSSQEDKTLGLPVSHSAQSENKPPELGANSDEQDACQETAKASSEAPIFQVDLIGHGSRVLMNGKELEFVRDVKVHQPLEGPTTVTIEFLASAVNGIQKP